MAKYLCEYDYLGSRYSITIDAESRQDAAHRLLQISRGVVSGELIAEFPLPIPSFLERAISSLSSRFNPSGLP